jgi:hypothetical protein
MLMNPHSCEYEFVFTAAGAVTLIPLMFAASVISSGSGQLRSCGLEAFYRCPDCRRRHAVSTSDLADRYATNELQPKNFAHVAHET